MRLTALILASICTLQFTTQVEVVRLQVLVERGGTPVTGLSAGDFLVTDSGVPQTITVSPLSEPIAVSTLVDLSGSITAEQLRRATETLQALASRVDGRDSYTAYGFAESALVVAPDAGLADTVWSDIQTLRRSAGARTAIFDSMMLAVVRGSTHQRPRVLILLTDGHDNASWLGVDAVVDAALRHETVIYPLVLPLSPIQHGSVAGVPPVASDRGLRVLSHLAAKSGGRLLFTDWSADLQRLFDRILQEYRHRYLITFVPTGVSSRKGWHPISVKLTSGPGRVHVREGYWAF